MSNVMPIAAGVVVGRRLGAAAAELLATSDFAATTRRVYERTLDALVADLGAYVAVDQATRAELEQHLRALPPRRGVRFGHGTAASSCIGMTPSHGAGR